MRRLVLIFLIVLSAATATEVSFRLLGSELPEPSMWYSDWAEAKAEIIESTDRPAEVVFLGDSSTMNGLDPHQFAKGSRYEHVFNAAIPGVTMAMIDDWYRRVVEPASDPQLVLIGLTTQTVTLRDPGPYFQSVAIADGWLGVVNRWLYETFWTVRYRGVARDPVALARHYRGTAEENWRLLDSNGWFTPPDREYEPPDTSDPTDGTILAEDHDALVSLVNHIQQSGADVVFVRMPETADRADTFVSGASAIQSIKRQVDRLAERLSVPVVDLSEISSTEWFTDSVHLDPRGSQLAGELLLEKLEAVPLRAESSSASILGQTPNG